MLVLLSDAHGTCITRMTFGVPFCTATRKHVDGLSQLACLLNQSSHRMFQRSASSNKSMPQVSRSSRDTFETPEACCLGFDRQLVLFSQMSGSMTFAYF